MAVRGLDRLLELQELDSSIDRLEHRRRVLESGEDVEEARVRAAEAEGRVGELRLELDAEKREEARLEQHISSLRQKHDAEQKRLYDGSVANPKELGAIQAEVRNIKERIARFEDQELEQMERREEMEGRLPGLERDLEQARTMVADLEASSERELADIREDLEQRRGARAALVPEVDEELLELYEDLRSSKRGVAAVALKDGVCQGCHEKLSALELDRLKRADGVRRCEHCRRILILD